MHLSVHLIPIIIWRLVHVHNPPTPVLCFFFFSLGFCTSPPFDDYTRQRIFQGAVASSGSSCATCIRLLCSSRANSCGQTAADNWQWRHFHGYSFTYCVFISSGQASMKGPLWIKLLLWSPVALQAAVCRAPRFLLPQQVHIKGRTKQKKQERRKK